MSGAPALEAVNTEKGLKHLNGFLQRRSYIDGYTPTQTDCSYFDAIVKVDASLTNVARWYSHIAAFSAGQRGRWTGTYQEAAAAAVEEKTEAAAEDEEEDLWGDDDFDEEADAAAEARIAAAAAAHNAKKEADMIAKGKTKARTLLSYQFEVKPLEAGQDMDDLANRIKTLKHDGVKDWGVEHKILDVAFGIQKILLQVIIFEDNCDEDTLIELMTNAYDDEIQSVDLIGMTKL